MSDDWRARLKKMTDEANAAGSPLKIEDVPREILSAGYEAFVRELAPMLEVPADLLLGRRPTCEQLYGKAKADRRRQHGAEIKKEEAKHGTERHRETDGE